jgi:hypothetical protein
MATMEERVSRLEGAYEQVDQRLGDIQAALHRHEAKTDAQFRTTMAVMATGGIAIAGAIVTLALRI